ncbi:hypothetical protein K438DRAFT_1829345 [Mycena galopus ATCC 62051]|nr:hypothetical protein K438DRAFT_1829345 [Mycena galopus ATCC 62051]
MFHSHPPASLSGALSAPNQAAGHLSSTTRHGVSTISFITMSLRGAAFILCVHHYLMTHRMASVFIPFFPLQMSLHGWHLPIWFAFILCAHHYSSTILSDRTHTFSVWLGIGL